MAYSQFYEMYKNAIKNTWTVEEVDFSSDIIDLNNKMTDAERHLINKLVAFFATGDSIVSNNLVLNLYKHINSPEARMYLSRQLFEEAVHIQFYLTLLDTYITDHKERENAFKAVETMPSVKRKAEFCLKWLESINELDSLDSKEKKKQFLLNLICFAACVEGMFFFAAFAYVYFLRSKGLLNGLAAGTSYIFREESMHMQFAFEVINKIREEEPYLFDEELNNNIKSMIDEAIDCEKQFAEDILSKGVSGLSITEVEQYLKFVADQRLVSLNLPKKYNTTNPFEFLNLQDVQEMANFFERRVSAYQVGVEGEVALDVVF